MNQTEILTEYSPEAIHINDLRICKSLSGLMPKIKKIKVADCSLTGIDLMFCLFWHKVPTRIVSQIFGFSKSRTVMFEYYFHYMLYRGMCRSSSFVGALKIEM